MRTRSATPRADALASNAIRRLRGPIGATVLISAFINLLALSGSLFSLQVYDRVLASQSLPTLVALLLLLVGVYLIQWPLDMLRGRMLARVGEVVDADLSPTVLATVRRQNLTGEARGDGLQPMRDLDQVRFFLGSQGPVAIFDLPWLPVFLAATFLLHPLLGIATLLGALLMIALLAATELSSKELSRRNAQETASRNALAEAARRSSETLRTMGLGPRIEQRWLERHQTLQSTQLDLSDVTSLYGTLSRMLRQLIQSLILAVGAYLVIQGEATAGVMIAASILTARTLAPIDNAVAQWRNLQAARQSLVRLDGCLEQTTETTLDLPRPSSRLDVREVAVMAPRASRPTIFGIDFSLEAGEAVAVLGPSAGGKSTLARGLLGVWPLAAGSVRLDGATLEQWSDAARGSFVGYLPQTVELFDGTIAGNISRFDPAATTAGIVAAAKAAGVHDMIVRLPEGYGTRIGEAGLTLSGGQRQRVGLARALYGKPFLIVLDEPNAALDPEGEAALNAAIRTAKSEGAIVVVLAHRPSILAEVDKVLVLRDGRQVAFGPRHEVLQGIMGSRRVPTAAGPRPEAVAA
jgi:ATP-binding cassette subfamily C protein